MFKLSLSTLALSALLVPSAANAQPFNNAQPFVSPGGQENFVLPGAGGQGAADPRFNRPGAAVPGNPRAISPQGGDPYVNPGAITPRVAPVLPPQTPALGVQGHFDPNGFHIEHVAFGTPAYRMGLEAGDVIVRINGLPIRCEHDLQQGLLARGGQLSMLVINVRTGRYVRVFGSLYQVGGGCRHRGSF